VGSPARTCHALHVETEVGIVVDCCIGPRWETDEFLVRNIVDELRYEVLEGTLLRHGVLGLSLLEF